MYSLKKSLSLFCCLKKPCIVRLTEKISISWTQIQSKLLVSINNYNHKNLRPVKTLTTKFLGCLIFCQEILNSIPSIFLWTILFSGVFIRLCLSKPKARNLKLVKKKQPQKKSKVFQKKKKKSKRRNSKNSRSYIKPGNYYIDHLI